MLVTFPIGVHLNGILIRFVVVGERNALFGKNTDIRTFLHGDVKTYDVLAAIHTVRKTHSTEHYQVTLLTTEEHMIPSYIVQNSLKTAYYWVLTRSN